MCILSACMEATLISISWPNCQKITKVIQSFMKSKFRTNIYLIFKHASLSLKLWFIVFCCFRTVRIAEVQVRKVLGFHIYCLTEIIEILRRFIVNISLFLFSQGSCSLCILSYTDEHPDFLEHYHTQIHGFKTPRDFKKFWAFPS